MLHAHVPTLSLVAKSKNCTIYLTYELQIGIIKSPNLTGQQTKRYLAFTTKHIIGQEGQKWEFTPNGGRSDTAGKTLEFQSAPPTMWTTCRDRFYTFLKLNTLFFVITRKCSPSERISILTTFTQQCSVLAVSVSLSILGCCWKAKGA